MSINVQFLQQLVLKPGSKSYGFWTEPPQPLYLDIYLWNWTNPEDIRNNSIKPNFVQIGPFRFQEYPSKTNVKFHDNSTVSYRKSSKYFFVPEDSTGHLDDVITSLNVISLVCKINVIKNKISNNLIPNLGSSNESKKLGIFCIESDLNEFLILRSKNSCDKDCI